MIELTWPWVLIILPAPIAVWFLMPVYQQSVTAIRLPYFREIAVAVGVTPQEGSVVMVRNTIQMATAIVCWVLIVFSLARPERIGEPIEINKAARDLILAVDISGSMDERDFRSPAGKPVQRLDAVKQIVGDFVEARKGDRIGLIVFGSRAFVQAPFTEDLRSVRELLDQTEVGMAGPHTALGDAIGLAIRLFDKSNIKQRLLIILSDGADTSSRMSPINAANIAARKDVEIHTIAVGKKNGEGEYRVDEETLAKIANQAGGRFYFADNAEELKATYDRIDLLATRKIETFSYHEREPLGHWLLFPAILLTLASSVWLQLSRRRKLNDARGVQA